jgi:hypothetical protein
MRRVTKSEEENNKQKQRVMRKNKKMRTKQGQGKDVGYLNLT